MQGSKSSAKNAPAAYTEHLLSIAQLANMYDTSLSEESPAKSRGLTAAKAESKLVKDGLNRLTPPKEMSFLERVLRVVFLDAFMVMLLFASALTFVAFAATPDDKTNLYLALALIVIVALTSALTLFQEGQASDVMAGFQNMLPASALVQRDGVVKRIPGTQIVCGDVVVLSTGDKVPADLRMIVVTALKVDNSSLTGEALPISACVDAKSDEVLEAHNMAFSGTLVVEGTGIGVAVRTGDRSMVGSIAALASDTSQEKSTLTKEIEGFVFFVGKLALVTGGGCVVWLLARDGFSLDTVISAVITFIVIIVANVPQGLPSAVAACLTVAAKKLAKRNVYVKALTSIETLGSVSVIASDKTGTLTQNCMTVTSIWMDNRSHQVQTLMRSSDTDDDKELQGSAARFVHRHPLDDSLRAMVFVSGTCNMAGRASDVDQVVIDDRVLGRKSLTTRSNSNALTRRPTVTSMIFSGRDMPGSMLNPSALLEQTKYQPVTAKQLTGNASDIALYVFAEQNGRQPVEQMRDQYRQVFQVPFSSARKWMLTVMAPPVEAADQSRILCVKGAPERILARCTKLLLNGVEKDLAPANIASFEKANERYMKQGRRVLALAGRRLDAASFPTTLDAAVEFKQFQDLFDKGDLVAEPDAIKGGQDGLVLLGCTALEDPPKETVPGAVMKCREAGIRVVMVTGDHPATATAIAKQCNIFGLYKTKEDVQRSRSVNMKDLVHVDDDDAEIGGVVVTGKQLGSFTDEDWNRVLSKPEIVFARTSPHDKLEIVSRLQARGEVVAVTGDGVNDSPALKKADVGVAMGIAGSDVAKDAGDIVLVDDEFLSLVAGIEQGRIIFDNLTKCVGYTLAHLMPELVAVLFNLVVGFPMGMTSLMILMIDLGTEAGPSISLAYEKAEELVMCRPPRDLKKDRLVSWTMLAYAYMIAGVIISLACAGAYFGVFLHHDINMSTLYFSEFFLSDVKKNYVNSKGIIMSPDMQKNIAANAQTAFFATLVLSQFAHIWMVKTRVVSVFSHGFFSNKVMNLGSLVSIGILILVIYVPGLHAVVGSAANSQEFFFLPALASLVLLWTFNEFRKMVFRNHPDSTFTKLFAW